ncbi:DNA adenine methylase [Methanospirillum stamsii]|uniref:site-specific DNA-methyltransferase (adenine-specific) n=1 Tax=Methanospirillum stamsii TaxID=1277351 RepID=A0A2V2N7Q5_9EURY|nr:DNA adenine methylase [Methanospirillum stamsii]PWR76052.1 modification methylase [Methanospirillum stamsii]
MKKKSDIIIQSIHRKRGNGDDEYAKPFLKWAGGKSQLLLEFAERLPAGLEQGSITRYVEPFVGGGAMFFYIAQLFPLKESVICDINPELILTWQTIKYDVESLIQLLTDLQITYDSLDQNKRMDLFYQVRDSLNKEQKKFDYNTYHKETIRRASQLIFLNRTCFNGLFRLNSKGEFNVPFGKYKNPTIVNEKNLRKVSALLSNTTIIQGDFNQCLQYAGPGAFIYIDPPYRPLNQTSKFTGYSQEGFFEKDQIRLSDFFTDAHKTGAQIMLSNSDPKNEDPSDHFFDDIYRDYTIERVQAKRMINSDAEKRGSINELIIRNYQ